MNEQRLMIADQHNMINSLETRTELLENKLQYKESRERRNNLRFQSLPDDKDHAREKIV